MANIRNLDAEIGANFIGDDAEPTLSITNTSTGPALQLDKLVSTSSATITQATLRGGNVSLAPIGVTPSANASAPALVVNAAAGIGGFVSCTSVVLTTVANTDYAIRVRIGADQYRWIPLFKDAAIIGGAAFA